MRIKKSSIILIVCILTIICFCDFIRDTIAAEESRVSVNWSGTIGAQTISSNQTVNLTGNVTLNGKITIPNGVTLTITGSDKSITRASTYTGTMFEVASGGSLYITGSTESNSSIVIDGNENVISQESAIVSTGNLYLTNTKIANNKNRATSSKGGAITINTNGYLEMDNCLITKNTACAFGGGFYSAGSFKITDTEISYNNAMTTVTAEKSGLGRGGGFLLTGTGVYGELNNVNINHNVAMYYGGAMQVQSGAELYFNSGTISDNEVILHGAGAVHLTASAKFTMDDGAKITNNKAKYVGGAIHTSYSCVLNLNGGEISGNSVIGRGAGVHINVGGELNLNGTNIINNSAISGMRVSVSTVDEKGDTYTQPTSTEKDEYVEGYGGGVLVDSGKCLMQKGTVSDNFASKGGGGIGLVMIAVGDRKTEDQENKIVSFTMEGGTIKNNSTDGNGGGIYLMKNMLAEDTTDSNGNIIAGVPGTPTITINGGTVTNNTAKENGGAAYLEEETGFYISGDSILSGNYAQQDGGAVYVSEGEAEISGGTISENYTEGNGGALYVKGKVTMSNATITNNGKSVTDKGGAVYVTAGSFTMNSGVFSGNESINGGALYIDGGDFLVTSGEMSNNIASNVGGAVYANGGNIVIGIEGCTDEISKHESPNTHPNITGNTAVFGGGGFMTDGTITMYCGKLKSNSSNNEGTGNNVYMNGGTFHLEGGEIGEETNPGIVLVGGKLNDTREEDQTQGEVVTMVYHPGLENTANHETSVTLGKYINLPAAQEGWVKDGYTMVGWTTIENAEVKAFEDYKSVGMAVKVENTDVNKQIHYYAVWAETTSSITYELDEGSVDGTNVDSYDYIVTSKNIHLISPQKEYYTFIGWRLTASEESITNWETYYPEGEKSVFYSVEAPASGLDLNIGTHFGDITLTAIYKANASDIEIVVNNENAKNQNYIFEISGTPNIDSEFTPIKVVVQCDENGEGSTTVKELLVGTYTVSLQNDWTWRYELSEENINNMTNIDIDESQDKYILNFEDLSIKNSFWLNGYNYYIERGK